MQAALDELRQAGWDTLEVQHAWRTDSFAYTLARTVDEGVPWERYGDEFTTETLLTSEAASASSPAPALVAELGPACAELAHSATRIMRGGRHELLSLRACADRGMCVINFRHNTLPGARNGLHPITTGGIRRHGLEEDPAAVVLDGLNLARAMTYKNVAAALAVGGSKLVLCADALDAASLPDLGFVAWCIDAARVVTGPDMNLSPRHADALRATFTNNIAGGERGIPSGAPTAYGVLLAIETMLRHRHGELHWADVTVAVQGVGAVGAALAAGILERGGQVVVADPSSQRIDHLVAGTDEERVTVVAPDDILMVKADVLAPCAMGGVITDELIDSLQCGAIIGAANNMLAADSPAEERRLAQRLHERGILFLIEWHPNVGGVIAGWNQWAHPDEFDLSRIHRAIEPRCTTAIAELLTEAARRGVTPTDLAYDRIDEALGYSASKA